MDGRDGALPLDFNKPIDCGKFDVITNVGFIEHIKNENQCFENIDNLTKDGGIIIHLVPKVGNYMRHKCYRWYVEKQFRSIGKDKNYKILDIGVINPRNEKGFDLIRCTYRKGERI